MRKIILALLVLALALGVLSGCNKTVIDTTYTFNHAFVALPDGSCVDGPIRSWKDWGDSDMIQVTFTDGTVYYTHSSNVVLIAGD
jgi:hypothetical protein